MSSPPPDLPTKSKPKKQSKGKEKSKNKDSDKGKAVQVSTDGRNEGVNPSWAYAPPAGMVALDTSHIDEAYDWEALKKDENKELWIMRVPDGFKVKQLEGLQISQPCDTPGARLTTLERKRAKYDVWAVDPSRTEDTMSTPRGEELTGISCLLPRKKKGGKLYIAPKPIVQHIIVTHAPAAAQVDEESTPAPSTRQRVPKHLLMHRFIPYGATTSDLHIRDAMDLDIEDHEIMRRNEDKSAPTTQDPKTPKKDTVVSVLTSTGKKAKKRKNIGESESPKRSKKPKV